MHLYKSPLQEEKLANSVCLIEEFNVEKCGLFTHCPYAHMMCELKQFNKDLTVFETSSPLHIYFVYMYVKMVCLLQQSSL